MSASEIKLNQEIKIAGETFRAMNIQNEVGIYFVKVLKNGNLANITRGNHGTYTFQQIDEYLKIGAFSL